MENKEKNFVSAVIYVRNAEKRIGRFLQAIITVMEEHFEHSEIICVNDFSDDESVKVIRQVVSRRETAVSVSILNMGCFHGLEIAMNAGVDLAIGDFVFEFDNTILDFKKEKIMEIYYRSLQGYDIVSASLNQKEHFTSSLFYRVFERFTDPPYKMGTESFRILSRRGINRIGSMNRAVPYRKAIYANSGLKIDNKKYEATGNINIRVDKKEKNYRLGLAVDSLLLFTEVGYRFSIAMTALMMFMSVFMLIYSVLIYITSNPAAGWTTTILFLSAAFFGVFGILTIITKYLQLLVRLVFRRKQYSYESIEKLTK
jgi:glycosyltransferase involved in cell wall biosynthesis